MSHKHVKTQPELQIHGEFSGKLFLPVFFAGAPWLSLDALDALDGCLQCDMAWDEFAELVTAPETTQQTSLLSQGLNGKYGCLQGCLWVKMGVTCCKFLFSIYFIATR
jgi:hypothetical protein